MIRLLGPAPAGLFLSRAYEGGQNRCRIIAAWAWRAHDFAHADKPSNVRLCPPYARGRQTGDVIRGSIVLRKNFLRQLWWFRSGGAVSAAESPGDGV